MSDDVDLGALLMERLAIVQEIAGLNARQLKNQQEAGGMELECMGCERELARGVPHAQERLAQLREGLAQALERCADTERELAACESRLDAVDLQLAGL